MNNDPTKDLPNNDALKDIFVLIQAMSEQLSALQIKVDERLYDTRPLWESVQSQINDLRAETEQGFRQARAEMEQGFRQVRAEMEQGLSQVSVEMGKGLQQVSAESKADIEKLRTELSRELRHLSYSVDGIAGNFVRVGAIQRDIESRIRDIESKSS